MPLIWCWLTKFHSKTYFFSSSCALREKSSNIAASWSILLMALLTFRALNIDLALLTQISSLKLIFSADSRNYEKKTKTVIPFFSWRTLYTVSSKCKLSLIFYSGFDLPLLTPIPGKKTNLFWKILLFKRRSSNIIAP